MHFGNLLLAGVDNPELHSLLQGSGYSLIDICKIEDLIGHSRPCDLLILSEHLAEQVLSGNQTPELCTRTAVTAVLLGEPYTVRHPELRVLLQDGTFAPLYTHEIANVLILKRIEQLILLSRITEGTATASSDGENERIRLEEEIRLREMVLRNEQETNAYIFASISSGLMLIDRDGTILRLNRAACRYLGVQDGAIGSRFEKFLPPEFARRCETALAEREGLKESFENVSSGEFQFRLSTFPIFDYGSSFLGILVHVRDITEQENVKANLYRAERLATIGTMLSGIAHELRNPLSIISAGAQRGRTKCNQTKEWNIRNYQSIETQASRCAVLINDLLDFARGGTLQPGVHEVEDLVEEAVGYAASQSPFGDIRLKKIISPGCRIHIDHSRFVQVLVNLLHNAAQAMNGSGRLEITAEPDGNAMIRILVHDTGPGIPPDTGDRIFDPFYTTKAPGKGTGLGLAIVHRIVRESGGTINYRSRPGETCFILMIPSG